MYPSKCQVNIYKAEYQTDSILKIKILQDVKCVFSENVVRKSQAVLTGSGYDVHSLYS